LLKVNIIWESQINIYVLYIFFVIFKNNSVTSWQSKTIQYMKPITSLEQFKLAATNKRGDFVEFFISLAGGLAKSSKRVIYFPDDKTFYIINEIDETEQVDLTEDQLKTETLIVDAIEQGAFFQY